VATFLYRTFSLLVCLFEVTKKCLLQEGCVMSIVKTRGLPRSDRPAEIEGSIRDLVRRESGVIRQSEDISEQATADLSSLVYRVSGESAREIDHLIDGLKHLRQKLDDDGRRVQREIGNSTYKDCLRGNDSCQKSAGCSEYQ
jgi:hypothetical protein